MAEFHFLRPGWLLALLPVVVVLARAAMARDNRGGWAGRVDRHLLPHLLTTPGAGPGNRWPLALAVTAWLAAVIALAGPTWSRLPQPQMEPRLPPLVVALDLSRSMRATDVPPSRLVAARHRTAALLEGSAGRPLGLVAFAGDAYAVTPLVRDPRVLTETLPHLDPGLMPVQGSRVDRALRRVAVLLDRARAGAADVVVITDGSHGGDAEAAASRLAARGRRVSVLAVGTAAGGLVPTADGTPLTGADGHPVRAPLTGEALAEVAAAGEGRYVTWHPEGGDLEALLAATRRASTGTAAAAERPVWRDRGPWLVLLLLPLAAAAFRRGWLGVLVLGVGLQAQDATARDWAGLWRTPDQQGRLLLREGEAATAAERFRDPAWRGVALYRAGRFREAAAAFARAGGADGHYNRGNALARLGDWPAAAAAYRQALGLDPGHADARHNLEVVEAAATRQRPPTTGGQALADEPEASHEREPSRRPPPAQETPPAAGAGQTREGPTPKGERQEAPRLSGQAPPPPGGRTTPDREAGERQGGEGAPAPGGRTGGSGEQAAGGTAGDIPAEAGRGEPGTTPPGSQGRHAPAGDAPTTGDGGEGRTPAGGRAGPSERAGPRGDGTRRQAPTTQVLEQWLERVPDEPGGLLRERFRMEQRGRATTADEQPW